MWEDGARGTAKGNCLGGTRGRVSFGTSGYIWQCLQSKVVFFRMSVIKPETQASQMRPGLSNQGACARGKGGDPSFIGRAEEGKREREREREREK